MKIECGSNVETEPKWPFKKLSKLSEWAMMVAWTKIGWWKTNKVNGFEIILEIWWNG